MKHTEQNMFQEEKVVHSQTHRTKLTDDVQEVHKYTCQAIP